MFRTIDACNVLLEARELCYAAHSASGILETVMSLEKSPNYQPVPEPRQRLQLSSVQILASALAAVTATIAGSFLGVNGTVIGAGIASVLTVTANAIYAHSLRRTGDRVRSSAPVARVRTISRAPALADTAVLPPALGTNAAGPDASRTHTDRTAHTGFGWRRFGVATVAVFVCMLALLTSVELVTGRPVSDLLRGRSGSGTTVFGASSRDSAQSTVPSPQPPVTVTRTVVPRVVITTPTVTQTAPAVTVTPTATPTGSTAPQTPSPSGPTSPGTAP
jgi:hypothetical protein